MYQNIMLMERECGNSLLQRLAIKNTYGEAFYSCSRILSRNIATNASNEISRNDSGVSIIKIRKQLTFREIAPIKLIIFRRFSELRIVFLRKC